MQGTLPQAEGRRVEAERRWKEGQRTERSKREGCVPHA